jgi:hypothetical protein
MTDKNHPVIDWHLITRNHGASGPSTVRPPDALEHENASAMSTEWLIQVNFKYILVNMEMWLAICQFFPNLERPTIPEVTQDRATLIYWNNELNKEYIGYIEGLHFFNMKRQQQSLPPIVC